MPRAGLTPAAVVAAGADLADEIGWSDLTLAQVAERVGVRAPSLYKHVASQGDLTRRIAALALAQAGAAVGAAIQGRSGTEALGAAARALRGFVTSHPGRYGATVGLRTVAVGPGDEPDPVAVAAAEALEPLRAVLRGYDIAPEDEPHALRALRSVFHGFATLESAGGFQYSADVDESYEWLIAMVDRGLRGMSPEHADPADLAEPADR
ncbi:TetR/AcrR family transcriptional regulator [Aquipuribacter hungaricus]|uniref:TetR/AcrR family transcriptional regulator n=1 Tax=Aquipuribacter hungaricus TaxID=545624 RepID=A0ABV7WHV0_9MICO